MDIGNKKGKNEEKEEQYGGVDYQDWLKYHQIIGAAGTNCGQLKILNEKENYNRSLTKLLR